ncbi:MAG: hypothetical protein ABIO71_01860 [Caldimonas sp.]
MRETLSCSVELRHFGVWRWSIGVVALFAAASTGAWAVLSTDSAPMLARVGAAAVTALLLAGALMLLQVRAGTLSLHAGKWCFAPFDDRSASEEGTLAVALDLGHFLLLILRSPGESGRIVRRWLPAQRRGLEAGWHALRCAAYAPQRDRERP